MEKQWVQPINSANRIEILDIIRGFAVFGILLSNILIISGFYFTPISSFKDFHLADFNYNLFIVSRHLIIGKSYPMFCMLFGIGFYMQFQKFQTSNHSFAGFFSWRLFILFMIGLVHLVVWPGDVVSNYALLGFLLIPLRKLKANHYLLLAIIMFLIYVGVELWGKHTAEKPQGEAPKRETIIAFQGVGATELIHKVQNDGIKGMAFFNKQQYKILYSAKRIRYAIPQLLSLFFLGIFLFSKGLITHKMYHWKYLLIFGLLGMLGKYLMTLDYTFRMFENVFMALFFISLFGIIFKTNFGRKLFQFLIPVGRMPLTNYIMQSVIASFIFYGIGLGLFTKLPYYGIYLTAFGILCLQSIYSYYWLKNYKYGPAEWLWRSLSYQKKLKLKIKS